MQHCLYLADVVLHGWSSTFGDDIKPVADEVWTRMELAKSKLVPSVIVRDLYLGGRMRVVGRRRDRCAAVGDGVSCVRFDKSAMRLFIILMNNAMLRLHWVAGFLNILYNKKKQSSIGVSHTAE